jgi:SAM-dependent methyltransferase
MLAAIALLFGIATAAYLLVQVRKPSRYVGRLFISLMNRHHAPLIEWGLRDLVIAPDAAVIDIGCGGGRSLATLAARAPQGTVCGIDYADGSVAAARAGNAALIAAGRVAVLRATVSQLPFPNRRFTLATAFETHYYWPDLRRDLAEVRRVLRPAGTLLLVAEASATDTGVSAIEDLIMKAMRASYPSGQALRAAMTDAGFEAVEVTTHPQHRGWLKVFGCVPG